MITDDGEASPTPAAAREGSDEVESGDETSASDAAEAGGAAAAADGDGAPRSYSSAAAAPIAAAHRANPSTDSWRSAGSGSLLAGGAALAAADTLSSSSSHTTLLPAPPASLTPLKAPALLVDGDVQRELAQMTAEEQRILQQLDDIQQKLEHIKAQKGASRVKRLRRTLTLSTSTSRELLVEPSADTKRRVICVSLRLPLANTHTPSVYYDAGYSPLGIGQLRHSRDREVVYVGCDDKRSRRNPMVGGKVRPPPVSVAPDDSQFIAVSVPEKLMEGYETFCRKSLRNVLHYNYSDLLRDDAQRQWDSYYSVNLRFANKVTETYREGDLIWVNDYFLMLLPDMLRRRLWQAKIGFFLHTPYPSAELFRLLPTRIDLLRGMLGADLIGFYAFDYAKQFTASCGRLLGMETSPSGVEVEDGGRVCEIGIYPGGLDTPRYKESLNVLRTRARITDTLKSFSGLRVIVGVDCLDDGFAGIPFKLLAFETFLRQHPEWQDKVMLFEVAMISSFADPVGMKPLAHEVNELVGRINATFGTAAFSPVHYMNSELSMSDYQALLSCGDVLLVTDIRDGMNIVPYEWTVCQSASGKHGPLILSEFSGAAQSFSTALHVNPWDVDEVADAIGRALLVTPEERRLRNEAAYRFVSSHTVRLWVETFLEDLEALLPLRSHRVLTPPLDFTLTIDIMRYTPKRKLILLDYDGTLMPFQSLPDLYAPTRQLLELLDGLTRNPEYVVYIQTIRTRSVILRWLGELSKRVGLVCENGFLMRHPGGGEWVEPSYTAPMGDTLHRHIVQELELFTERTPCSVMDVGEGTLMWFYNDALDFGHWQARELYRILEALLANVSLEVTEERGLYLAVRPTGMSKVNAVRRILEHHGATVGLVFSAGDTRSDEEVFACLHGEESAALLKVITCKIGAMGKPTSARNALESPARLLDFLHEMLVAKAPVATAAAAATAATTVAPSQSPEGE